MNEESINLIGALQQHRNALLRTIAAGATAEQLEAIVQGAFGAIEAQARTLLKTMLASEEATLLFKCEQRSSDGLFLIAVHEPSKSEDAELLCAAAGQLLLQVGEVLSRVSECGHVSCAINDVVQDAHAAFMKKYDPSTTGLAH